MSIDGGGVSGHTPDFRQMTSIEGSGVRHIVADSYTGELQFPHNVVTALRELGVRTLEDLLAYLESFPSDAARVFSSQGLDNSQIVDYLRLHLMSKGIVPTEIRKLLKSPPLGANDPSDNALGAIIQKQALKIKCLELHVQHLIESNNAKLEDIRRLRGRSFSSESDIFKAVRGELIRQGLSHGNTVFVDVNATSKVPFSGHVDTIGIVREVERAIGKYSERRA